MFGPLVALIALGLSLGWALFLRAGTIPSDWASTVLFVGAICLLYWLFVRRRLLAPAQPLWVRCAILALPLYCAFQLLPLPLSTLRLLSPARAELVAALAPVVPGVTQAPLSVNPPMAIVWTFSLLCYIATFFLVRELGWRLSESPWVVVTPLLAVAALEALTGLVQVSLGLAAEGATGTYAGRNHFSGLLELILPFAVMQGWAILQGRDRSDQSFGAVVRACIAWGVAILILVAISYSLSRMGFFVALFTLFVVVGLSFGQRPPSQNFRAVSLTLLAVGMLALFIFLPPDQLLTRFSELSSGGKVSSEARLDFWKGALAIIGEFRWFGVGLGGFESTFLKHQSSISGYRVEMADNDYLQYLAELGVAGFAILAAACVGILIPVVKGLINVKEEGRRLFLVASAGSFLAIALHSIVDFNLYIPANAMTLAWIAGAASINGLE